MLLTLRAKGYCDLVQRMGKREGLLRSREHSGAL
jgi:hypothetical protein